MGTAGPTGLSYEDLQEFPDDNLRRELIDGELLVTPAPARRHQRAVIRLAAALLAWVDEHGGEVLTAPFDVRLSDDTVVEPDVLLVRAEHLDRFEESFLHATPDLVVEVSLPSTRGVDLVAKRRVYERFGVRDYWFVDLDGEQVLVHRLGPNGYESPRALGRGDVLGSPQLPTFRLAVDRLFARLEPPRS